jgi:dTDP-4-amino-4,6-dideoxygalactose transaminase
MTMPGPGAYLIGDEEKKALMEVIETGYLFRYGDKSDPKFLAKVWRLEQEVSKYLGIPYTVAVNSGTMALWIALGAIGIGPGDEVIVPGYTFIASITSIIYARAVPVLTEIDRSLTLDPEDVKKKITPRTKAIMLVHMLGNPGRVDEIKEIARSNGISLIEDCAQAFGVKYKGKYVGHFGDFGIYSFNVFKTITAGDGGMVATSSRKLYERAFAIHDQGHLPLRQGVERGSRTVIGLDCRMTELSAAVLLAQLKKADMMKKLLKEKKKRFKEGIKDIKGLSFRDLPDPEGELGTLLTVFLPDEKTARKVGDALGCGVVADSGWHVYNNMEHVLGQMVVDSTGCPFTCPYYREKGGSMEYSRGMLPRTDALISRAINISIGVFDAGLGSGFGINITSDDKEIDEKIARFRKAVDKYL